MTQGAWGSILAARQSAGALKELAGRDDGVGGAFGGDGALVAVTEGLAQGLTGGREAHVVHRPTVDGDGCDAFRSCLRGLAQTLLEAGQDGIERPAKPPASMDRAVGDAMDEFDFRLVALPAEQGDTAAFGA
jgi:hypothetical protein